MIFDIGHRILNAQEFFWSVKMRGPLPHKPSQSHFKFRVAPLDWYLPAKDDSKFWVAPISNAWKSQVENPKRLRFKKCFDASLHCQVGNIGI